MSGPADTPRRPGAYRLPGREPEPPRPAETPRAPRSIEDLTLLQPEPEEAIDGLGLEALEPARPRRRGFSFAKLALGALSLIASLGFGLMLDDLVRQLFLRNEWLGWAALGVSAALVIGVLGVATREAVGLMRLSAVERERRDARLAFEANDQAGAERAVAKLSSLLSERIETAAGRARLASLKDEVIDGADLLALAEREMLLPLDIRARALVRTSAQRVSVVTAVSPKALVDIAYVLFETVRLIRRMAELYGTRPGTLGLVRLTRDVLAHLAVTGTLSIGDGLMQQVVGHGLAAKLSARLGEGVVNGLLTARVGLAAMDLCRPVPFLRVRRPSIGDFIGDLAGQGRGREG